MNIGTLGYQQTLPQLGTAGKLSVPDAPNASIEFDGSAPSCDRYENGQSNHEDAQMEALKDLARGRFSGQEANSAGGYPSQGANKDAQKNDSLAYVDVTLNVKAGKLVVKDYAPDPKGPNGWSSTPASVHSYKVLSGNGSGKNNPDMAAVKDKGPVPAGSYYIGTMTDMSKVRSDLPGDKQWYPILNQTNLKNSVTVKDPSSGASVVRDEMFFHPGRVSDGCVTFWSDVPNTPGNTNYPRSNDYDEFKKTLMNTTPFQVTTGPSWWQTKTNVTGIFTVAP